MEAPARPILWHIPISHYSEKARWALAYKCLDAELRAPPPGAHIAVALWLTRGAHYTVPVLELDGERIGDSTAIIAALERRFPDPPLYPADAAERRRALELEDWLDEELGPYVRRLAFHELRREPERFLALAVLSAPELFARGGRAAGAIGRAFTGLRYSARDAAGAEEARRRILAALDRIEAELGDRDHLVGERFTVADLTGAALLYPLVLPAEGLDVAPHMPERYQAFRRSVEDRRAFRWAQEMYRRHRLAAPESAAAQPA